MLLRNSIRLQPASLISSAKDGESVEQTSQKQQSNGGGGHSESSAILRT